ncbi:MAG: PLP-dependent transferase [Candidatus Korarchaeota archaeon]|nr:PLP-dependent transferase [Candidatus Korarchaeota archaeon]
MVTIPFNSATSLPPDLLREVGIDCRTVRLAVGLEDPDSLIADLDAALRASRGVNPEP